MTSELEDLQIRIMELSKTTDDLNAIVVEQSKQIHFLEQKLAQVEAQIAAFDPAVTGSVSFGNETPPHY